MAEGDDTWMNSGRREGGVADDSIQECQTELKNGGHQHVLNLPLSLYLCLSRVGGLVGMGAGMGD